MLSKWRYKKRLNRLIHHWSDFRTLILERLGHSDVKPVEERRFMDLKGRIAEELANIIPRLGHATAQESRSHQKGINDILNYFPSLYADASVDEHLRDDFEREWHRHYLFLNKLKGVAPKAPPAKDPHKHKPHMATPPGVLPPQDTFGSWLFRFVFRATILVAVVWAAIRFTPWEALGSDSEAADTADRLSNFVSEMGNSIRGVVSNFTSSQLGSSLLEPVVGQYGPEVTTILLAVLLLALGYWVFVRVK